VRKLRALAILIASIALTGIAATMLWSIEGKRKEYELFRFYLPWDDGSETVTHVKSWARAKDRSTRRPLPLAMKRFAGYSQPLAFIAS